MKTFKDGYQYGLINVENPHLKGQLIQFIERAPLVANGQMQQTVVNGTSVEEVIEVALAKVTFDNSSNLNGNPSFEKTKVKEKLTEALLWLDREKKLREPAKQRNGLAV